MLLTSRSYGLNAEQQRKLALQHAPILGLDQPLLLTAMCIIYDEGKRLPHDKYLLYDRIVDTVLHKRYADKESLDPIRGRLAEIDVFLAVSR